MARLRAPVGLTLMALAAAGVVRGNAASVAAQPDIDTCGPTVSRTFDKLVIGADEAISATTTIEFDCPDGARRLGLQIAVENTDALNVPGREGRQLMDNLREGLANVVADIDYDNGSLGGLILYGTAANQHTPLQGGSGGRQALRNAVNNFPIGSARSAVGVVDALDLAVESLGEADLGEAGYRAVLVVDAGANLGDEEDLDAACARAHAADVHVSVLSLEAAGARMRGCADEHLYRASTRMGGQDIPDTLDLLGDGLVYGDHIEVMNLVDALLGAFRYVEGSGAPEEPFLFSNELTWTIMPEAPDGNLVYSYRVEPVSPDSAGVGPISRDAALDIAFRDSRTLTLAVDNPDICVFPAGQPEACDGFVGTETPQSPTPTEEGGSATAVATTPPATTPPPEDTPLPTEVTPTAPTATGDEYSIYLPRLLRETSG